MGTQKRRELPTSEELAVWRAHVEAFDIARSRIEARLHQDSQLSAGDYKVLLALSEADGKTMRSSELAAEISWERSRLSGQLGRMEKRGLIRREPCVEDARGSHVILSIEGAAAFRAATIPHLRAIKEIFVDAFDADQLPPLGTAAAKLRMHLAADLPSNSGDPDHSVL